MKLVDTIARVPVIVTSGTGGVGKTSISVAIAIELAQERSARVLVLTIDPAKRLAKVLSEDELHHDPILVDHSKFIEGSKQGELYAAMVDTELGWKEIVERYAKSGKDASRIFENNLYANLTKRFSHSHDFVAMDQLYKHYRSGNYDYIILDTPPTSKAFGFFDAPQAMSDFFGGKLVRLVTSPYRVGKGRAVKIFDVASQPFFALADKVLGKEFLNDIGEFFFLFHTMYDDFAARSKQISEFLCSKKTHSVLVVNTLQFITNQDLEVQEGLEDRNIEVDALIVNGVAIDKKDLANVKDFLSTQTHQGAFSEYLEGDLALSADLYSELDARLLKRNADMSYALIKRISSDKEGELLSELTKSIQTQVISGDTI